MRFKITSLCAAIICGLSAGCASPLSPDQSEISTETGDDALFQALAIPDSWPSVRIAMKDAIRPAKFYAQGLSDVQTGRTAQINDQFPIASVTKALTAIVVLQLIEAGELGEENRIVDLLPDGRLTGVPNAEAITLGLLDHSSGLYAPNNNLDYLSRWLGSRFEPAFNPGTSYFLDLARQEAPTHAPGDGHAYSDLNYLLLGNIVEQVTGQPFQHVVRAQVFDPLGLDDTYFVADGAPTPAHESRLVRGYLATSPELESFLTLSDAFETAAPGLLDTSAAYAALPAASGVVSSLDDLASLFDAVLNQDFLAPSSRARFIRALTRLRAGAPATVQDIATAIETEHGPLLRFAGDGTGVAAAVFWDAPTRTIIIAHTNVYGHFDEHQIMAHDIAVPLLQRGNLE
ncbi:beta-lactamase family protein [Synechococcus sp. MU1644]|nr:beta-lactamase family protein [Synechococcus sp. MU1644]